MRLTAEQLTAFLAARKSRIAEIVAPDDVENALPGIHARIWPQLPLVKDEKSLDSLVGVEAVDFALKKYYTLFRGENPDRKKFDEMLEWNGNFVEAQIDKTIRIHLFHSADADIVKAETLATMWEKRDAWDRDKGPWVAWARGIAHNKARSYEPFDKRTVSTEGEDGTRTDPPSPGRSPEEVVVAGERDTEPEGPPPEAYAELLQMLHDAEPHKAIAFIFNRYLRIRPAQIAALIGGRTLPEALAEASRILKERHPEFEAVETLFSPLAQRIAGSEEKFGDLATGAATIERHIGQWGETTQNSIGGRTVQQGKRFLTFVCKLAAAAHEIVCFLWIRLLYSPPVALRHRAGRPLTGLIDEFDQRYAERELLSESQVGQCTGHLRDRVRRDGSLDDFAGADLYASVKRWCAHIDSLIADSAGAEHMLGYAYIVGSLRKGKERI